MDFILGHKSALRFWRYNKVYGRFLLGRAEIAAAARRYSVIFSRDDRPTALDIKLSGLPDGVKSDSLSVVVSTPASRIRAYATVSRLWNSMQEGCFIRLDRTYCVSVPEACFVQLAADLDLIQLIEVGYELAGTYSILDGKAYYNVLPVASRDSLVSFAEAEVGRHGAKRARRAARYVLDNSASPAESKLAMVLTLPPSLGGYGLPAPKMNAEVPIPARLQKAIGHAKFRCDLLWETPKGKVAVEYKSNEWHLEAKKIVEDSERNNALRELGIHVIEVTAGQLYNANATTDAARQISKAIGFRMRTKVKNPLSRRFELRKKLLKG